MLAHLTDEELKYLEKLMGSISLNGFVSKRSVLISEHGYDTKFAYHVVRLLGEVEQILIEGDLDLQSRGEWTQKQIEDLFSDKERLLEETYNKSELPWGPDEDKIKGLLLECLEMHYGNLEKTVVRQDQFEVAVRQIFETCQKTLNSYI